MVYCKPPFDGVDSVYAYLGRYTHRIGLSNRRLLDVTDARVTLATRHGKRSSLPPRVFLRRFLDHVLPHGFVRIRHYGLMASANVHSRLVHARDRLQPEPAPSPGDGAARVDHQGVDDVAADEALVELVRRLGGPDLRRCGHCNATTMRLRARPLPRAPPC